MVPEHLLQGRSGPEALGYLNDQEGRQLHARQAQCKRQKGRASRHLPDGAGCEVASAEGGEGAQAEHERPEHGRWPIGVPPLPEGGRAEILAQPPP